MRIWHWFEETSVLAIHDEQLQQHGGLAGVRDLGLLKSALARPEQLEAYGSPDVFDLAAAYAHGMVRNHPFADGNKRTAFVLAETFLVLHEITLLATDEQCYLSMIQLATGEIEQDTFAAWLRANSGKR
jgi:death-on-curing protein